MIDPNSVERRAQERRGRWEDRCDFIWSPFYDHRLICDRPDGHKGMHSGRLIKDTTVIGYARRRS
jgi:hypothetical protein